MAYTVVAIITACAFVTTMIVWYCVPHYFSRASADFAHPVTLRMDGVTLHLSVLSSWLVKGSFFASFSLVVTLVALGLYYRYVGLALPAIDRHETIRLHLDE